MRKSESSRKYAYIAAICYVIYTLFTIVTGINTYDRNGVEIPFLSVAFWLILIGMTAALFMGSKKAIAIIAGINVLYEAFFFVRNWRFGDALDTVVTIVLLVVLIFALKDNDYLHDIWFVPAVARFAIYILNWISARYFVLFRGRIVWYVLFSLTEVAALVFMGIWLNRSMKLKNCVEV